MSARRQTRLARARHPRIAPALVLSSILLLSAVHARSDELSELERRVSAQERELEAQRKELETLRREMGARSDADPAPRASAGALSISSDDGRRVMRIHGLLQVQGRWFPDDVTPASADTVLLRRVRPTLEVELDDRYAFRLTADLSKGSSTLVDAYLAARLAPWGTVTVGKFKPPVGLERLQSVLDTRFAERALPTSLVPNRDVGVHFGGALSGVQYAIGYFNGVPDGASSDSSEETDTDSEGDWAARVFTIPFGDASNALIRGLGFGVGTTYGDVDGSVEDARLPSYRTPGQQIFFRYRSGPSAAFAHGRRIRVAPQAYYYLGPLGVILEYTRVSQRVAQADGASLRLRTLHHDGWHIAASWFLTGEQASFKGFATGYESTRERLHTGVWELTARYHALDIDDDAFAGGESLADPESFASKATAAGVGVNWHVSESLKLTFDYERTRFDQGGPGGRDRDTETALFTQLTWSF